MLIIKNSQPLYKYKQFLYFKKGRNIFRYNLSDNKIKKQMKVKHFNFINLFNIDIINRLFRNQVRAVLNISNDELIVSHKKKVIYINLSNMESKILHKTRKGFSTPLNISKSYHTDYLAFFGDYGSNKDLNKVNLYGIKKDLSVTILYQFQEKSIRHIHNIVHDNNNDNYIVLTGDNEVESGIYFFDKNFKILNTALGSQKYRAVFGFVKFSEFVYVTDSVEESNFLYKIYYHNKEITCVSGQKLKGPVIYGKAYNSGFIISTVVESSEIEQNRIKRILSNRPSKGINTEAIDLIYIDNNLSFAIIKTLKKDKLPYKLFQYGTIMFPEGMQNSTKLIYYPIATKKHSGSCCIIDYFEGK